MSMFIVSNDCLNDVSNLVVKMFPYMDLNDVFNRLLNLNVEIWNNKYNKNVKLSDLNYTIKDYSKYVYTDKERITRFKSEYWQVQITQLIESLRCYNYQIEENYIKNLTNRFTYSLIKELYNNPLITEIMNFIKFNDLDNCYDNENKIVKNVIWDR